MAILTDLLETPYFVQGACVALFALLLTSFWEDIATEIPYRGVPLIGKEWWQVSNKKARNDWNNSARALMNDAFAAVS